MEKFLNNTIDFIRDGFIPYYREHLDITMLIEAWQNKQFNFDHGIVVLVLALNLLLLFLLVKSFMHVHANVKFNAWLDEKRKNVGRAKRINVKDINKNKHLEAKIPEVGCLSQAYNLHRFAMYDASIKKYRQALQTEPEDINIYLVGVKMLSEMDAPDKRLVKILRAGVAFLCKKDPQKFSKVAIFAEDKMGQSADLIFQTEAVTLPRAA